MNLSAKELRACEDEELVKLAQAQNQPALEILITRHCAKLRTALISRYGKRFEQDAYDAVQNAGIKAYKNIKSFKGDSSFYSWFYAIAVNEAKTIFRKAKYDRYDTIDQTYDDSDKKVYEPEDPDQQLNPIVATHNKQLRTIVMKQLDKLSEKLRIVVYHCDILGYKPREVAKMFHLDETTVRTRLHNGHKKLLANLQNIRNDLLD